METKQQQTGRRMWRQQAAAERQAEVEAAGTPGSSGGEPVRLPEELLELRGPGRKHEAPISAGRQQELVSRIGFEGHHNCPSKEMTCR